MYKKIIIRCDAGKIAELGTGHLYRCITLYFLLKKKFKLKKKDILFLIKTSGKYSIAKKILSENNILYQSVDEKIKDYSFQELNFINKFSSKLLIIDRLGKINKKSIINFKKNHKKIVLFDDSSNCRNLVNLAINPLITNVKKIKKTFVGYKYNIIPSFLSNYKKKSIKGKNLKIFLSFGGFDNKNLTFKAINYLKKSSHNYNLFLNKKLKKTVKDKTKIIFFDSRNYYKNLINSDLVFSAGGLSMFDAIFLRKFVICIPQYKHQNENINILNKKRIVYKLSIKDMNKIDYILGEILKKKVRNLNKRNMIINSKLISKTLKLIYKQYDY